MEASRSDGPPVWGYIEGYYGRLLDWPTRAALVDHIGSLQRSKETYRKAENKVTGARPPSQVRQVRQARGAYLYAPKEDSLHRRDWRVPYPKQWRQEFQELATRAHRREVDLVPGMAPGLSYNYLSTADYRALLKKMQGFQKLGCQTMALLMDDIPPVLPKNCVTSFTSLGEAHGLLLRRVLADLNKGGNTCVLWFCPTVYTDMFATGPIVQDRYLLDLAATMPVEIPLMWTGPRIISERLDAQALRELSQMFRGNVLLWDNLYANDYCPNKIFLGPYKGRTADLWKLTRGVLLNPTGLPFTDRLLLELLAAFQKNVPAEQAWREIVSKHKIPKQFLAVAPLMATPFFQVVPKDLTPRKIAAMRSALKSLIWDWKGELHQEWYPYLFMLDADLKAYGMGDKIDKEWVSKRYPALVAEMLLAKG